MADNLDFESPDFDPDAWIAQQKQVVRDREEQEGWMAALPEGVRNAGKFAAAQHRIVRATQWEWMKKMPRNAGAAVFDAAFAAIDLVDDVAELPGKAADGEPPASQTAAPGVLTAFPTEVSVLPDSWRDALTSWRQSVDANSGTLDRVTQGIAQFAIPFTGFMKALKVTRAPNIISKAARAAGAEAAAVATAFQPHDARAADILDLGRHAENQFGRFMADVSPDGSMLNAYIDYMTARENESEFEGRFKNVVDSLAVSAAAAGLIKAVPATAKAARKLAVQIAEGGPPPGSPAAQGGWIGYHGTPHKVDRFSAAKVGSGEGNQAFGHGLYFAESKDVANVYRGSLTRRGVTAGSPMDKAMAAVQQAGGDQTKAYQHLVKQAQAAPDKDAAQAMRKAADIVRAGNAKPRGELLTVEIDDSVVEQMLEWDKPLAEQPEVLRKLVEAGYSFENAAGQKAGLQDMTGGEFMRRLSASTDDAQVSADLLKIGIPGVRYLDGNSRSAAEGTRNLVLFDDSLVSIKDRS
jgi:hypothetical protein